MASKQAWPSSQVLSQRATIRSLIQRCRDLQLQTSCPPDADMGREAKGIYTALANPEETRQSNAVQEPREGQLGGQRSREQLEEQLATAEDRLCSLERALRDATAEAARAQQELAGERARRVELQQDVDKLTAHTRELGSELSFYLAKYVDASSTIRVLVRPRPPEDGACGEWLSAQQRTITIAAPSRPGAAGAAPRPVAIEQFAFDRVFQPSDTDDEVFRELAPVVSNALESKRRVLVMAYGYTGSGKSHTVSQLLGRATDSLERGGAQLSISALEVYGGQIKDLLGGAVVEPPRQGEILPRACVTEPGRTAGEVRARFEDVARQRRTASTQCNGKSSRSHLFLSLHFPGGSITFADLAGNEDIRKSGVAGDQRAEAVEINKSLSALGRVMLAMAESTPVVPFRGHVLTQLLGGLLGLLGKCYGAHPASGVAKVVLIATIRTEQGAEREAREVLKFAEKAR